MNRLLRPRPNSTHRIAFLTTDLRLARVAPGSLSQNSSNISLVGQSTSIDDRNVEPNSNTIHIVPKSISNYLASILSKAIIKNPKRLKKEISKSLMFL